MADKKITAQRDSIKSPDDLNSYLRVTNPSMWLIFAAVLILLVGLIIGSSFYEIKSTVYTTAIVKNNNIYIQPSPDIEPEVRMLFTVEHFDAETNVHKNYDVYIDVVEYDEKINGFVGQVYDAEGMEDGEYSAYTIKSDTPISYLFN